MKKPLISVLELAVAAVAFVGAFAMVLGGIVIDCGALSFLGVCGVFVAAVEIEFIHNGEKAITMNMNEN